MTPLDLDRSFGPNLFCFLPVTFFMLSKSYWNMETLNISGMFSSLAFRECVGQN